jgi:hypothetical protein
MRNKSPVAAQRSPDFADCAEVSAGRLPMMGCDDHALCPRRDDTPRFHHSRCPASGHARRRDRGLLRDLPTICVRLRRAVPERIDPRHGLLDLPRHVGRQLPLQRHGLPRPRQANRRPSVSGDVRPRLLLLPKLLALPVWLGRPLLPDARRGAAAHSLSAGNASQATAGPHSADAFARASRRAGRIRRRGRNELRPPTDFAWAELSAVPRGGCTQQRTLPSRRDCIASIGGRLGGL